MHKKDFLKERIFFFLNAVWTHKKIFFLDHMIKVEAMNNLTPDTKQHIKYQLVLANLILFIYYIPYFTNIICSSLTLLH